jgi:hypothetical protein
MRRVAITVSLLLALLLAGAVPAAANHGTVQGSTWYSDGTTHTWGYPGHIVSVYATNAYPGIPFVVAAQPVVAGQKACGSPAVLVGSPTVTSGANGFIPTVSIAFDLPTSTSPGSYWLCFFHVYATPTVNTTGLTYTAPVLFTVLPDTTS